MTRTCPHTNTNGEDTDLSGATSGVSPKDRHVDRKTRESTLTPEPHFRNENCEILSSEIDIIQSP